MLWNFTENYDFDHIPVWKQLRLLIIHIIPYHSTIHIILYCVSTMNLDIAGLFL